MHDRRRFVIDTDTASDDAVALLMALRHPDVEVVAITVVAGNVPVEMGVQNALYCVELAGASVPVYSGCAAPLAQELRTAHGVHGGDGMGDIGLALTGRVPADGDAVDVLVRLIGASEPGELTLVTLGPLTNVAMAFTREPSLAGRLREIVVMGGTSDGLGNASAAAEFNIWVDPEAAAIVFAAGARLTMVGWDISRKYATFDADAAAALRAAGPLAAFSVDIQRVLTRFACEESGLEGFDYADPVAMAVALDPSIATNTGLMNVVVETKGEFTRGMTVCDHRLATGRPRNTTVVLEVSKPRFVTQLHELLGEPGRA
jgi:purine nucleosidase